LIKEVDSLSEWDAYSMHNSIIYWGKEMRLRGTEGGGFGGNVANIIDERTGEILKGDVFMGTSQEAYSEMYFIRAAPLDKRAQKFPFPDDLLGELYQSLVAHEVGHVFGLMDSHYGEFAYPFEKMNDVEWLKTMGHTPSVMNYTRQNNSVQPEDSIPPSLLNQKVGPMDRYQIRWGYTEFSPNLAIEDRANALEKIIRLQDTIPWYRYNHEYEDLGPATTDEVVESRDPVQNAVMGLKNLERVIDMLPEACKDQKDNARLLRLYKSSLELWYKHMHQVVTLVGGYDIHLKGLSQSGNRYQPISFASQQEALSFVLQNTLYPPNWLTNPAFTVRTNHSINPDKVLEHQMKILLHLLNSQRLKRLEYQNRFPGFENIFSEYFSTVQHGVFKEMYEENGNVSPRKMEIQLTYIDMLIKILKQERLHITANEKVYDYTDYSKGLMLEQLISLKKHMTLKTKRSKIKNDVGHWNLCLLKLKDIPLQ